jgi:DNA-binding transcriptional MocR family regulator
MKDTGLSKRTVERAINELEELGWLARQSGRGKKSNNYSFPVSAIVTEMPFVENSAAETFQKTEDGESFEPFAETASIPDREFRLTLDRHLFWIQKQKNLSRKNFRAKDWFDLLLNLKEEDVLPHFQEFYSWTVNKKWVNNVTPKLLVGQIEAFKKGNQLENKKQQNS